MKLWKFTLAMTAVMTMSSAPLAKAAEQTEFRKQMNQIIKDTGIGNPNRTFNDLWKQQYGLLDTETQQILGSWMANNGNQKVPSLQATSFVDKNGVEEVRLVFSKTGKPQTLSFKSNKPDSFQWNGVTINATDARNIKVALAKMAASDSDYKEALNLVNKEKNTGAHGASFLTGKEFEKLKPVQKVEYMQKLREALRPAEQILRWKAEADIARRENSSSPLYALFVEGFSAWAPPRDGDRCIVAGMVSIYESGVCKAVPSDRGLATYATDLQSLHSQYKTFHQACGGGSQVACNPLLYGFKAGGQPYCLNSSDQPTFTNKATEICNNQSPLAGTDTFNPRTNEREISAERRGSYRRILESYATVTGADTRLKPPSACFTEQNYVKADCIDALNLHLQAANGILSEANRACESLTRADQKAACQALRERALGLARYIEQSQVPPVTPPVSDRDRCKGNDAFFNEETKQCACRAGSTPDFQMEENKIVFRCPVPLEEVVVEGQRPKDNCDKDNNGKKDKSFRCSPGLWIGGLLGVGLLIWLLRNRKKPKPPTPPTVTLPPGTTMPTVPGEGGSGENGGNNGGVRGRN